MESGVTNFTNYTLQQLCPDLHSPLIPMFRQLPVHKIDVSVSRLQVPEFIAPEPKLVTATLVTFVPFPTKQFTLLNVSEPLVVISTASEVTEITSMYDPAHFV